MNDENVDSRNFSLKAFKELTEEDFLSEEILLSSPLNVAVLNENLTKSVDDSAIKRVYQSPFTKDQHSLRTTPRRPPSQKYYYCPSNTIVASNGGVYHVEPFMLPPPQQISEMIRGLTARNKEFASHDSYESPRISKSKKMNTDSKLTTTNEENDQQVLKDNASYKRMSVSEDISHHSNHHPTDKMNYTSRRASDSNINRYSLYSPVKIDHIKRGSIASNKSLFPTDLPPMTPVETPRGGEEPFKSFSFIKYIKMEMLGIIETSHIAEGNAYNKIENFIKVPLMVEKLIYFGLFVCLDAFLYVVTYLPIRSVIAIIALCNDTVFYNHINHTTLSSPIKTTTPSTSTNTTTTNTNNHNNNNISDTSTGGIRSSNAHSSGHQEFNSNNNNTYTTTNTMNTTSSSNSSSSNIDSSASSNKRPSVLKGLNLIKAFNRTHRFDLIRGILLIIGCYVLKSLNMSRIYHYIRGQNMIKLYVLTAMLEVFDRLFGSFGQDAFEALHSETQNPPFSLSNIITYIVLSIYVIIHSGIYFVYVATLLVAVNSAEQALITVLFLNNFAEIKSFVFKKFDRISLFQLTCGDITERFQLSLFLVLISIVSIAQAGTNWYEASYTQLMIFLTMLSGESIADWIKHAFIAKFNSLDSSMYDDMLGVLRKDIINLFKDTIEYDHNYSITRRIGLSQIPLACVTIRYIILAMDSPAIKVYIDSLSTISLITHYILLFLTLLCIKILVGVSLIHLSGWLHNLDLSLKQANFDITNKDKLKEHKELMKQLSNIERYTLYKGRVHG